MAYCLFFFFNDTATTEIYTLSLHDALPISVICFGGPPATGTTKMCGRRSYVKPTPSKRYLRVEIDRKSTRLNSSHSQISYAVFCLKKKNKNPSRLSTCCRTRVRCRPRIRVT